MMTIKLSGIFFVRTVSCTFINDNFTSWNKKAVRAGESTLCYSQYILTCVYYAICETYVVYEHDLSLTQDTRFI